MWSFWETIYDMFDIRRQFFICRLQKSRRFACEQICKPVHLRARQNFKVSSGKRRKLRLTSTHVCVFWFFFFCLLSFPSITHKPITESAQWRAPPQLAVTSWANELLLGRLCKNNEHPFSECCSVSVENPFWLQRMSNSWKTRLMGQPVMMAGALILILCTSVCKALKWAEEGCFLFLFNQR